MLSDLGYDAKTVHELLGHTTARITMDLYIDGRNRKKKEAVSAKDVLLTASCQDPDLG